MQSAFFCVGKTHGAFLCAAQEGKWSSNMEEMNLCRQADTVNELLARYGVKFGIYIKTEHSASCFFPLTPFRV